jgi:hypothetical protein
VWKARVQWHSPEHCTQVVVESGTGPAAVTKGKSVVPYIGTQSSITSVTTL